MIQRIFAVCRVFKEYSARRSQLPFERRHCSDIARESRPNGLVCHWPWNDDRHCFKKLSERFNVLTIVGAISRIKECVPNACIDQG